MYHAGASYDSQTLKVAPPFPLTHAVTHWFPAPELVPLTLLTMHAACLWDAPLLDADELPVC